jgi:hypothetical protein
VARETIYYCEIAGNYTPEFSKGVTSIPWKREYTTKITRCISYSDRVWVQGPRGGVKIVKNRRDMTNVYGYVTKNEKLMKEFMWVKLQAQTLAHYN